MEKHLVTINFNAPVGQYVAHVEKQELYFDKQMQMHVGEVAESSDTEQSNEPVSEDIPSPKYEDYAHWVETSNSFPKIGKELVSLAETARTKAGFVRSLHDITETEIDPLFKFKKEYRTDKCRAEFVNYMLQTYGYTGKKVFVDDDFQRIYTFKPKSKR